MQDTSERRSDAWGQGDPLRKAWQIAAAFMPGESPGQATADRVTESQTRQKRLSTHTVICLAIMHHLASNKRLLY